MSSRFRIQPTSLDAVKVVQRVPVRDDRGFLERMFCAEELACLLNDKPPLQINRTLTIQPGTVRGMHFQGPPYAEAKLVTCLRGEIFDVAVDLRAGSATYLKWHAEILSESNNHTLFIPEGFAHGFQTLVPDCELLYFHTALYNPASEGGVNALDPAIDIRWPLPIASRSPRDTNHPWIDGSFAGIRLP